MREYLIQQLENHKIDYDSILVNKIIEYHNYLCQWNQKFNLTNITDDIEAADKHYIDSLVLLYNNKSLDYLSIIDIGTGAGFPGIPLAIFSKNANFLLLDSLNKRVGFLNFIIEQLELKNIKAIHSRAEDAAHLEVYRENFDMAVSRAVAPLNVLSEYMLPFVKIGGNAICYKGNVDKLEIFESQKAINVLGGGELINKPYSISYRDWQRSLVYINKVKKCSLQFPRKSGIPKKLPL